MAHDDAGLHWVFGTGYRPDQDPLQGFTDQRVAEPSWSAPPPACPTWRSGSTRRSPAPT